MSPIHQDPLEPRASCLAFMAMQEQQDRRSPPPPGFGTTTEQSAATMVRAGGGGGGEEERGLEPWKTIPPMSSVFIFNDTNSNVVASPKPKVKKRSPAQASQPCPLPPRRLVGLQAPHFPTNTGKEDNEEEGDEGAGGVVRAVPRDRDTHLEDSADQPERQGLQHLQAPGDVRGPQALLQTLMFRLVSRVLHMGISVTWHSAHHLARALHPLFLVVFFADAGREMGSLMLKPHAAARWWWTWLRGLRWAYFFSTLGLGLAMTLELVSLEVKMEDMGGVIFHGSGPRSSSPPPPPQAPTMVTTDRSVVVPNPVDRGERRSCCSYIAKKFLSAGQSEVEATLNLNAMNQSPNPWNVSFSYARALQHTCLRTWGGRPENGKAAQDALLLRAKANSLAQLGKYTSEGEAAAAKEGMYVKNYSY